MLKQGRRAPVAPVHPLAVWVNGKGEEIGIPPFSILPRCNLPSHPGLALGIIERRFQRGEGQEIQYW